MIYYIGDIDKLGFSSSSVKHLSLDVAIREIKKEKLICEDVETFGLDFHVPNILRLIQIGTKNDQFIFDPYTPNIERLKEILDDKSVEVIVANVAFERNMLRSIGVELNSTFDVLLGAQVLREGRGTRQVVTEYGSYFITSLAGIYYEYLEKSIDKGQQSSFLRSGKFTLAQIEYAAEDVKMFDIYEEIKRRLIKNKLLHSDYDLSMSIQELADNDRLSVTVLEQKVALYFADMTYNGIFIDFKEMLNIYEENLIERYKVEEKLNIYVKETFSAYSYITTTPFAVKKVVQTSLFGEDTRVQAKIKDKRRINWGSSTQVQPILELEVGEKIADKHGKRTVSIKVLDKPRYTKFKLVRDYIEYKKLCKLLDTYGITYKKYINERTGRIHTSINQVLETGRISSRKPNLAQIPGKEKWRKLFRSQDDTKIVGADYSGQESRVMAGKANDEVFIDFFVNGDGDSHSMVASRVYTAKEEREVNISKYKLEVEVLNGDNGNAKALVSAFYPIDITKVSTVEKDGKRYAYYEDANPIKDDRVQCALRQKGKVLNFFISFGGSYYTLSFEQGITLEEAKELIDSFWAGFKQLKVYFDNEKKRALKYGYIRINSITKRIRWLPKWKEYRIAVNKLNETKKALVDIHGWKEGTSKFYKKMKEKGSDVRFYSIQKLKLQGDMERAAMNSGIQGTAADMTKVAECLLHERIYAEGLSPINEIRPVNHIHDELMLEVYNAYAELSARLVKESMEDAARILIPNVPIPAVPYINTHWVH